MKKQLLKLKTLSLLFFIGFIWLTFNQSGIIKWYLLKSEKDKLIKEISELMENEQFITKHIDKLSNDLTYLEFLAYSKYKMVKPGEKIFKVKDYKDINK